ncbi:MAG: hypothetical protein QOD01_2117 [Actinomycetota bacterium]|nr:hypothetical protein [Actinomycetota bacterium]
MRAKLTGRTAIAIYILAAGVLLANVLYLSGIFQGDPSVHRSGVATGVKPNLFPGDYTIDPNDGFTSQALGHLAAMEWLHGHVPYWNHYEGVGTPLAGEMQSAAMFPLVLLLALPRGLLYMHVLLELLAGVSTYLLLRRLGRSETTATVGGLVFALSGTFAWLTNAIFNPVAFLPLLVLSVEIVRSRTLQRRRMGWVLMAVALALSLYAGFPEVAFLDALFAVGWAVLRLVQLPAGDRLRFVGKLTAGGLVGLALAAPIIVAFLDYLVRANSGAHLKGIGEAALPGIGVYSTVIPYLYGPIFGFHAYDPSNRLTAIWGNVGGFVTATAFGLGVLALWSRRDRALKLYLALWALLATMKTYGFGPVAKAVNLIPGITATAFYRYATVSVEFAVIVLASYGIDDLLERRLRLRVVAAAGSLALLVIAYFAVKSRSLVNALVGAPHHTTWAVVSTAWALAGILLMFGFGLLPAPPRVRRWLVAGIIAVDSVGMFIVPQFSAAKVASLDLGPVRFLRSHLGSQRYYGLGPIAPNYGSYFGVASINANDALLPKEWSRYVTRKLNDNVNPLTFTGADPANPLGPSTPVEFVDHLAGYAAVGVTYVLEVPNAIPPDRAAQHGLKRVWADDFFEILQVPEPAAYWHMAAGATCTIGRQDVTRADVDCATGGTLVRLEQYMPGWEAVVNGSRVPVQRSGDLFQEVQLRAGHNRVVFTFAPPHIGVAWALCFLGIALAVGAAVVGRTAG